MLPTGRKEIGEAVITAALTTAVTAFVGYLFRKWEEKKKAEEEAAKKKGKKKNGKSA